MTRVDNVTRTTAETAEQSAAAAEALATQSQKLIAAASELKSIVGGRKA